MKFASAFGYSDDLFKVKGYDGNYYPLRCRWEIKEEEPLYVGDEPTVTITLETFGFVLEKTLRGEMAEREKKKEEEEND